MVSTVTPILAAMEVDALRTEWALNISVLIPALFRTSFNHRAMVEDVTGPCGWMKEINNWEHSSEFLSLWRIPLMTYWAGKKNSAIFSLSCLSPSGRMSTEGTSHATSQVPVYLGKGGLTWNTPLEVWIRVGVDQQTLPLRVCALKKWLSCKHSANDTGIPRWKDQLEN